MPCAGTNKRGEPCRAPALKGREHCATHAPDLPESQRFRGGPKPGAGRPRIPKPTELARQLVETHVVTLLRPHFRTLGLMLNDDLTTQPLPRGAVVVHQGEATTIEDLGAQIAAAEKLLDRVYGKPRQAVEHTGKDDGPIEVAAVDLRGLDDDELAQLQWLLERARAAPDA